MCVSTKSHMSFFLSTFQTSKTVSWAYNKIFCSCVKILILYCVFFIQIKFVVISLKSPDERIIVISENQGINSLILLWPVKRYVFTLIISIFESQASHLLILWRSYIMRMLYNLNSVWINPKCVIFCKVVGSPYI